MPSSFGSAGCWDPPGQRGKDNAAPSLSIRPWKSPSHPCPRGQDTAKTQKESRLGLQKLMHPNTEPSLSPSPPAPRSPTLPHAVSRPPQYAPKPRSWKSREDAAAVSEPPRTSSVGGAAERLRHRRDWRRARGEPASCSPGFTTPLRRRDPLQPTLPAAGITLSFIHPPTGPFPLPRQLQNPFLEWGTPPSALPAPCRFGGRAASSEGCQHELVSDHPRV